MAPCPQCEKNINKKLNICPFCEFVIRKEKNALLPLIFSIFGASIATIAFFGEMLSLNNYVAITLVILGNVMTFSFYRPKFKIPHLACIICSGICMIYMIINMEMYFFLTLFLFYAFIGVWSNLKRKNLAKYAKH